MEGVLQVRSEAEYNSLLSQIRTYKSEQNVNMETLKAQEKQLSDAQKRIDLERQELEQNRVCVRRALEVLDSHEVHLNELYLEWKIREGQQASLILHNSRHNNRPQIQYQTPYIQQTNTIQSNYRPHATQSVAQPMSSLTGATEPQLTTKSKPTVPLSDQLLAKVPSRNIPPQPPSNNQTVQQQMQMAASSRKQQAAPLPNVVKSITPPSAFSVTVPQSQPFIPAQSQPFIPAQIQRASASTASHSAITSQASQATAAPKTSSVIPQRANQPSAMAQSLIATVRGNIPPVAPTIRHDPLNLNQVTAHQSADPKSTSFQFKQWQKPTSFQVQQWRPSVEPQSTNLNLSSFSTPPTIPQSATPTRLAVQPNKTSLASDVLRSLGKKRTISSVPSATPAPQSKRKPVESPGTPTRQSNIVQNGPTTFSVPFTSSTLSVKPSDVLPKLATSIPGNGPKNTANVASVTTSAVATSAPRPMDPNPAGSAVAGPSQVIIPASSNQVKSNTAVPISSEPDSSNLVSPSFSPIVEDHTSIAGPSNGPVRRMSHVLVPQSPWADREKARARRQKDMARSEAVLTASTRPVVVDPRETEAMQVSLSRLRERHCKWKSCGVVANSANNLCAHLSGHLEEQQTNMSLTCLWHQCGRQFRSGEEFKTHVDSHATSPLWCSFENCDESFRSARQLFAHNHKHANHRRRRSTAPRPLVSPPPFDSPAIMPSYMVEARAVVGRSISKARHEHIGPWVLQNIHAPIRISKYNAAKQPRRSGAHGDTSATGFDDYEFLGTTSTYSTNPSEPSKLRHLPDLNSTEVSQLAHDGLILWSPENKGEREGAEDADDDDDEWAQIEEASLDYMS